MRRHIIAIRPLIVRQSVICVEFVALSCARYDAAEEHGKTPEVGCYAARPTVANGVELTPMSEGIARLPVNIDQLIHPVSIEDSRIEYKSSWTGTSELSIVASISAFANDIMNLNGGYIVLGIEAPEGKPNLPPKG